MHTHIYVYTYMHIYTRVYIHIYENKCALASSFWIEESRILRIEEFFFGESLLAHVASFRFSVNQEGIRE